MIIYNPKDWLGSTLSLHRSETLRKLYPFLIAMAVYSWAVAYVEIEYLKLSSQSWLRNIPVMHSLLGFALSILLVFRTNTAYDRWWEGRKLWGLLTNNSRNLAIRVDSILPTGDRVNRNFYRKSIALFATTLKEHLQSNQTRFMLDEKDHPEFKTLDENKHGPNQVSSMIFKRTNRLYKEGLISGDQLIILNQELLSFADICGACERIKNTPIPFTYTSFIKKFISIYVLTLPYGFVFSLGYFVIPAVVVTFYVLTSLELIAEEIEDPFGSDLNDLPLGKIAENIRKHINEILN
ncbi:bestrophin family protein [Olivibacter sp. SDN3]|uniref:bestrophin family protein n=1 Tax=Olivibacter sp. SDN3 TaxID=2764720 RepID=UPI0016515145|nr:bestrophin family protein [Olivibacter sp. SDN3]QNL51148.1 bestrophin family protein [Olivibacter sp. SDN3]